MVAIKRRFIILLLLLILNSRPIWAKSEFKLVNNFMFQSGKGGKQVQDGTGDQSLNIYEPVFYFDLDAGKDTHIFGNAVVDLWSSASEAIFDTSTGASGRALTNNSSATPKSATTTTSNASTHWQHRLGFNLGVSKKVKTWTFSPMIGYSNEFDYVSYNGGGRVDKSFANDNFTASLGYYLFVDKSRPFDVSLGNFKSWQSRITHTIDISASQILTPSDLILFGYTYSRQNGFLSGTQNTVNLSGTRINEILPSSRNRHALSFKFIHGFSDAFAAHLDYRFYLDDWGVKSHSIEPSLNIAFNNDQGLIRLHYRFYKQNAVNYYQDQFPTAATYMTSDSDLDQFSANEFGLLALNEWHLKNFFLKTINVSGGGIYYRRSNDLQGTITQFSLGGSF